MFSETQTYVIKHYLRAYRERATKTFCSPREGGSLLPRSSCTKGLSFREAQSKGLRYIQ